MVVVSYSGKEINAKLVYYGPGLSGKTTNLEHIYSNVPNTNRGKMVSMKTRTERTLFFDFLPIDLGDIGGFKTRFLLYTVPGQVYYNATRKLVLRGVDAIIFVADSARDKMAENIESLQNLHDNLSEYGLDLDEIPFVIQYNKRDLPDVYSVEELEKALNPNGVPCYEVVATTGQGVFESFRGIARLLMQKLGNEIKFGDSKDSKKTGRPKPQAKPAAPPSPSPVSITPPTPESPANVAPPTPKSPEPTTPLPAREGDGVPYRPASMGPSNREAPVADRGTASPAPAPPAPIPETPEAKPPDSVAPSGDGLVLSSSEEIVSAAEAPTTPSASPLSESAETQSVDLAPATDEGGWDEAQAAAEDAALEAEISKRSAGLRQKRTVELGDEDETDEAATQQPGFWGRLFRRKTKMPSVPPQELLDEGFEPSAFEDSESALAPEGAPEPEPLAEEQFGEKTPELPSPLPVESHDNDESADIDLAELDVAPLGATGATDAIDDTTDADTAIDSPVLISRRVEVPITLTPEEIVRGAKLRLVMEITVQAPESAGVGSGKSGNTKAA
jgi:signal recognition particle receptor subunit beta